MKVCDLMMELRQFPSDEQVVVETDAGGVNELYPITGIKATTCPTERSQSENKPDPSFVVISSAETKRVDEMTEEEKKESFERWQDAPLNEGD